MQGHRAVDVDLPAGAEVAALRTAAARLGAAGLAADTSTLTVEGAWHLGPGLWVAEAPPNLMTISGPCYDESRVSGVSDSGESENELCMFALNTCTETGFRSLAICGHGVIYSCLGSHIVPVGQSIAA